ncbi:MAG TPA: MarR family transcriptional regulator [Candidatus Krumholzibacteria bacterium]|nr:MarR family transcriptional regulator [Candidatus Krumholzibacteria bacterium]
MSSFLNAVVGTRGVTLQQYNVLRILRGAEPDGLPTLVVAERMIERAPGITRMIDRLEEKGLVARERRGADRRCVHCRITGAGLDLLAGLDEPVDRADRAAFDALNQRELSELTSLLERVRDAHGAPAEGPDD